MVGTVRIVKKNRQSIFLNGTVLLRVASLDYPQTPSWFSCDCYNAEGGFIEKAVYCRSFLEHNTEVKQ